MVGQMVFDIVKNLERADSCVGYMVRANPQYELRRKLLPLFWEGDYVLYPKYQFPRIYSRAAC